MKAVVPVSHGNGCDVSREAAASVEALRAKYEPQGVAFRFINSNLTGKGLAGLTVRRAGSDHRNAGIHDSATGTIPYQMVKVKNPLDHGVWVRAIDYLPGQRAVLHHVIASADGKRRGATSRYN